jgi:hypothetical protein
LIGKGEDNSFSYKFIWQRLVIINKKKKSNAILVRNVDEKREKFIN